MMTQKMLSAVVVCYKDEGSIRPMYERLTAALAGLTSAHEIIFVNDASPDGSRAVLQEIADRDPRVTVIHQSRNFGAQAAFTAGMVQAVGDAVILLDGDLQDPPELIPLFAEKWLEGYQVVYGIRRQREESMGKLMQWAYHGFYVIFQRFAYMYVPQDAGEFSLMDRKAVDWINVLPERDRLIRGLRAWVGFRQCGVEYVRAERHAGRSTNSFWKNVAWARKSLFSFSYAPLHFVFYLALTMMCLSFVGIVFYITGFFLYPDVPQGMTTVFTLTLLLGSTQLFCLAIIAEYIGRMFEETKARPRYITAEIVNDHRSSFSSSVSVRPAETGAREGSPTPTEPATAGLRPM